MNKKVSIIIPVYNSDKFLFKCLESVLNQTYTNIEVLVINDGSTDNSLDIINKIASGDKRVNVINKKNGGVSSARNLGLIYATGEYVGFVDSDDFIKKDMYHHMVLTMEKMNADIAECGFTRVDSNYNELKNHRFEDKLTKGKHECSKEFLSKTNTTNFVVNKLYKMSVINDFEFPAYSYSEDYFFNAKVFENCYKKVTTSECFYYYYTNEESAIYKPFTSLKFDGIKAAEELLEYYKIRHPNLCPLISLYIIRYILNIYLNLREQEIEHNKSYIKLLRSKFREHFVPSNVILIKEIKDYKTLINMWIFFFHSDLFYLYKRNKLRTKI